MNFSNLLRKPLIAAVLGASLIGVACGLAGGLYLSRFLEALIFEVRPLGFWSLTLPLGALLCSGGRFAPAETFQQFLIPIELRWHMNLPRVGQGSRVSSVSI